MVDQETAISETSTTRLGQRLRRARLARNLTQGEVARNQFSVSYVSAVERGQIRPSLGALEKLADRLQVPVTDLLGTGDLDAKLGVSYGESREASADRYRDEVDSRLREARIHIQSGHATAALEMLRRLNTPQLSSRESALTQLTLARCYLAMGNGDEARRVAGDALALAERVGDRDTAERLRNTLGEAYSMLHSDPLALEQYRGCLNAISQGSIHDPAFKVTVLYNLGRQYANMGDTDQAIEHLRLATHAAQDVVNPERLGAAYWAASAASSSKGDSGQARMYAQRSLGAYEEAQNRRLVGETYTRLGRVYAQAGQVDEALKELQAAYNIASSQQDVRGIADAQRGLAAVYLAEGRLDDAAQAAQEALDRVSTSGSAPERADSLITLAQVQERQGAFDQAEASFNSAIDLLGATGQPDRLREAYASFSEYLERRGDSKRAFAMLKNAYQAVGR